MAWSKRVNRNKMERDRRLRIIANKIEFFIRSGQIDKAKQLFNQFYKKSIRFFVDYNLSSLMKIGFEK